MESKFIEDIDELNRLAPVTSAPIRYHIFVCTGKSCSATGSPEVKETFERELKSLGILFGNEKKGKNPKGSVVLTECASVGFCAIGVAVLIYPDGVWYAQVRPEDVREIIQQHILGGKVLERLALVKLPVALAADRNELAPAADWEA